MLTRWITPYGGKVFRWCFAHMVACVQKFRFFASRARTRLAFLSTSFFLLFLYSLFFSLVLSFLVSFSFFFFFFVFLLVAQKRHQLTCRHYKIKRSYKMMNFCYLYITNDDVFAKCSFILIWNVYFAIFIISSLKNIISFIICNVLFTKFMKIPNFRTLHVMCAILFLHTLRCMCNFVATIVIFAHIIHGVQFCFCTLKYMCAIFLNR